MREPAYPAARAVAGTVEAHFARQLAEARAEGQPDLAPEPDAATVEAIIDTAFWASLQREEGRAPRISLALLPPERAGRPVLLERPLPLTPDALTRLAPAVERPGIHLGVWRDGAGLHVWGATRTIPCLCFVLEVVEPGLLVVKHRRGEAGGKFANVAVLQGDRAKLVDFSGSSLPPCPTRLSLLALEDGARPEPADVLVQLAVSMRAHGRGGLLLLVPEGEEWRESIVHPIGYSVAPSFSGLAELLRRPADERQDAAWHEALRRLVDGIAGLTAVDGAVVMSDSYRLLAFGAKIGRRDGRPQVREVILTEPVPGGGRPVVPVGQLGGTRHLSAAQFVHDQRDALALVASQDGRFAAMAWSPCDDRVHVHRIEMFLL